MSEKSLKELKGELVELEEKEGKLRGEFKQLVNRTANLVLEMIRKPVEECDAEKLYAQAKRLKELKKELLAARERVSELKKKLEG